MRFRGIVVLAAAAVLVAPTARAADREWTEVGRTPIPLNYYQGMTHDEAGNRYFTGIWVGLYRTDPALNETGRNDDVIPPEVHAREGYNHVGDLSYAQGNLYLPLECYYPPLGNTCKTGAIGIADPETLTLDYYVKLDPGEIAKAMWCEVSPDGTLLWTQSGKDLLAYDMNDLTAANAAPDADPITATRRLRDVVPPEGITGATFIDDRLFVAGQDSAGGVIYSIDLTTGSRHLETRVSYVGESEGLDDDFDLDPTADALMGSLHYMVMPYNEEAYPTNGVTNGVIYHFERPESEVTSLTFTDRSTHSGQYSDPAVFEARLVDSDGDPIANETVTFSIDGDSEEHTASTNSDGIASVGIVLTQPPGEYTVTASYPGADGIYSASSASSDVTIEKEDSATTVTTDGRGHSRTLEATLFDADTPSSGIAGRTIDFYADGDFIGSATTDDSGTARIEVPSRYRGGRHTFEAR
ncbi:MAG: Ig-like domain-containing protein, partial [Actinobacteria bacterium]|nr:Ig-like domain-containing protein [Actinomycetota bacterium]